MSECPYCGTDSDAWDSDLSDQFSGATKAMTCPQPSCPVIHFKASPKVV